MQCRFAGRGQWAARSVVNAAAQALDAVDRLASADFLDLAGRAGAVVDQQALGPYAIG
jgi:hypothetical protein